MYTYCGETLPPIDTPIEDSNKCYFIDEAGYIFDDAPYFSGAVYLKFYGATGRENPLGAHFFEPNFRKLVLLKDALERIDLKPVIFDVKDNGDISVFLTSLSSSVRGPEVILKSDADMDKVVENLQSVLDTEPLKSDFRNKYSSLIYIDLRFGNKVYYKFK